MRERGPMDSRFEEGYVPMDEPPGIEEREYAFWKAAGGVPLTVAQLAEKADRQAGEALRLIGKAWPQAGGKARVYLAEAISLLERARAKILKAT